MYLRLHLYLHRLSDETFKPCIFSVQHSSTLAGKPDISKTKTKTGNCAKVVIVKFMRCNNVSNLITFDVITCRNSHQRAYRERAKRAFE